MKERKLNNLASPPGVAQLVNEQKRKFSTAQDLLEKQAVTLGEKDGFMGLPVANDPQTTPNEDLLRYEYRKLLAECRKKGKPYLDGPHLAVKMYEDKLEEMRNNGDSEFSREMEVLEQKSVANTSEIDRAFRDREEDLQDKERLMEGEFHEVRQDLQQIQEKTGRNHPLIHFKSGILYFLLLLGIGLCEVPLNLQIFQKFGEAFFITIIMASSLAIAIPVLAHFTGVFIKQRKEKREYNFFIFLCVALFGIFNFGVSVFRTSVLADAMGESTSQLTIVIFTCLNLILFIIGVLASYFRHDESYELEHIYEDYQKSKKVFNKEKSEISVKKSALAALKNAELKTVHQAFEEDKNRLHNKKDALIVKRNEHIQKYDELLNSFAALEDYIEAGYHLAIGKYRAANLGQRKDRRSPVSWIDEVPGLNLHFAGMPELDPN
ncbi:MAG: putative membrane channel-forming protein YqfA (hemolysin III family) [Saprospiraceae bacterium]|jgi:predicted membrane channel-forming protein YqfA (hemolysin III family)